MLRRIHGKTFHVGKVPKRSGGQIRIKQEIDRLKRELQEAVNAEEYERAAVIRDKIKELEQNQIGS
jgi:protein arginine kinase activator